MPIKAGNEYSDTIYYFTGLIVSYCDLSSKMLCNTFIGIPLTYCYKIGISFTSKGLLTPDESWSESEKIKNKWQTSKNNFTFISCPFEHECSTNASTKTCTSFHSTLYTCCYRPQRSCGKVMFLHLSISHSVHRGCLPHTLLFRHTPWADTPTGLIPPGRHPPCPVHAGIHSPPVQCMLGYGQQAEVRILLKCILVYDCSHHNRPWPDCFF